MCVAEFGGGWLGPQFGTLEVRDNCGDVELAV